MILKFLSFTQNNNMEIKHDKSTSHNKQFGKRAGFGLNWKSVLLVRKNHFSFAVFCNLAKEKMVLLTLVQGWKFWFSNPLLRQAAEPLCAIAQKIRLEILNFNSSKIWKIWRWNLTKIILKKITLKNIFLKTKSKK